MRKTEQKFLIELKHSAEALPNSWWIKLPDRPVFGDEPGKPRLPGSRPVLRFTIKNPFDALFAINGRTIAIEAKAHTKSTAWPLSDVRPHQIEALEAFSKTGQPAVIIVNVRYGLGKERVNFAAVFTAETYRALSSLRKSIPCFELKQSFQRLEWNKGRWSIENLGRIDGIFGEQKWQKGN